MFGRKTKIEKEVQKYTEIAEEYRQQAVQLRRCSDAANHNGDNDHAAALGKRAIECDAAVKMNERIALEASYGIFQPDYNW